MDLAKKYYDSNVNERNILEMVKLEPVWAAERIHELEEQLEQKEDFANVSGSLVEFIKWIEDNLWTKWEVDNKTTKETPKWYNTYSYNAMEKPLSTEELIEEFNNR